MIAHNDWTGGRLRWVHDSDIKTEIVKSETIRAVAGICLSNPSAFGRLFRESRRQHAVKMHEPLPGSAMSTYSQTICTQADKLLWGFERFDLNLLPFGPLGWLYRRTTYRASCKLEWRSRMYSTFTTPFPIISHTITTDQLATFRFHF